jgi:hypothetical protein
MIVFAIGSVIAVGALGVWTVDRWRRRGAKRS